MEFTITILNGPIQKQQNGLRLLIDSLDQEKLLMKTQGLELTNKKVKLQKVSMLAQSITQQRSQHLVSVQEVNGKRGSTHQDQEPIGHQVISDM